MILEIFSPGFIFLPIGVAALITAAFCPFFEAMTSQLVIFSINLVAIFFLFKKVIQPKVKSESYSTGADAMIGKEAQVVEEISADGNQGYVKLYGDRWRAINVDNQKIETGQKVTIEKIDGNKVFVKIN